MANLFEIKDYKHLIELLSDLTHEYCKKCKENTAHLRRGFIRVNDRWCCLKCEEKNGKRKNNYTINN